VRLSAGYVISVPVKNVVTAKSLQPDMNDVKGFLHGYNKLIKIALVSLYT